MNEPAGAPGETMLYVVEIRQTDDTGMVSDPIWRRVLSVTEASQDFAVILRRALAAVEYSD